MKSRVSFLLPVLLLAAGACRGETPDDVLGRLAASAAASGAVELDYAFIQYRNNRLVETRGTTQYHSDGKRFLNTLKTQVDEKEVQVRMVCDEGGTVWTEVREGDQVRVVQRFSRATLQKLGGGSFQDPKGQLEDLRRRYAFSEVHAGKLGDRATTVLEGTLKADFVALQLKAAEELGGKFAADQARPQLEAMVKARVQVDPASGQIWKTELLDKAGEILLSFELTRLKTGVALEDSLFTYQPPPGVEVLNVDRAFQGAQQTQVKTP